MKAIYLTVLILFTSFSAHAIYIEPYVAYLKGEESGTIKVDGVQGDIDYDSSGAMFGAKLGFSFLLVAVGVDYQTGKVTEESSDSSLDDESDTTDIGAFVSLGLPIFRLSATYFASSVHENDDVKLEGNGLKLTVGFSMLPFININLDYITHSFDEASTNGTHTYSNADFDRKEYMIGISLPLDL